MGQYIYSIHQYLPPWLDKLCPTLEKDTHIVINCSGRGDKDVNTVASSLDI